MIDIDVIHRAVSARRASNKAEDTACTVLHNLRDREGDSRCIEKGANVQLFTGVGKVIAYQCKDPHVVVTLAAWRQYIVESCVVRADE